MKRSLIAALILTLSCCLLCAQEQDATSTAKDRAALEKDLAARLSNSRLSGSYTIEGQKGPPQNDEYRLGKVEKGEGDRWKLTAQIAYGNKSLNVPLEIPILWAGDTPVISLDSFTIPGMGTYSAHLLITGDHYAGTWSSPRHGGSMWGRIEKASPQETQPAARPHGQSP